MPQFIPPPPQLNLYSFTVPLTYGYHCTVTEEDMQHWNDLELAVYNFAAFELEPLLLDHEARRLFIHGLQAGDVQDLKRPTASGERAQELGILACCFFWPVTLPWHLMFSTRAPRGVAAEFGPAGKVSVTANMLFAIPVHIRAVSYDSAAAEAVPQAFDLLEQMLSTDEGIDQATDWYLGVSSLSQKPL